MMEPKGDAASFGKEADRYLLVATDEDMILSFYRSLRILLVRSDWHSNSKSVTHFNRKSCD